MSDQIYSSFYRIENMTAKKQLPQTMPRHGCACICRDSQRTSRVRWMLLRPCILQYMINFPGSPRSSRRPLSAAQTVYLTIHY